MKSRLLALASAALVARRAVAAPAAHAATGVVISQAAFGGPGGGNDEVIEIRNVSAAPRSTSAAGAVGLQQQPAPASARATRAGRRRRCPPARRSCSPTRPARSPRRATCCTAPASPTPAASRSATAAAAATSWTRSARTAVPRLPRGRRRRPAGLGGPGGFVRKNGGTQDTDDNVADFTGPRTPTPTKCGTLHRPRRRRGRATRAPTARRRSRASRRSAPTPRATARRSRSAASSPASTTSTARTSSTSSRPTRASGSRTPTRDPQAHDVERAVRRRHPPRPGQPGGRDRRRHHDQRPRRDQVRPGRIVPDGVGNTGSPAAQEVDLATASRRSTRPATRCPRRSCSTSRCPRPRTRSRRPYYRSAAGHARPVARGHRDRRRHDQVP